MDIHEQFHPGTYSKQWAAVKTHWSCMSVPPHRCSCVDPFFDSCIDTNHGHSPYLESWPPTIRFTFVCHDIWSVWYLLFPQCSGIGLSRNQHNTFNARIWAVFHMPKIFLDYWLWYGKSHRSLMAEKILQTNTQQLNYNGRTLRLAVLRASWWETESCCTVGRKS